MNIEGLRLAVIGLGYVGLPLAVAFANKRPIIGFDKNPKRVKSLKAGVDQTLEVTPQELLEAEKLQITDDQAALHEANCFIIAVPTPIDVNNRPNLEPLMSASEIVGKVLKVGDIVIYESTVFPGATEETCVPALEKASGLKFNRDFFCGYSPERVNPGDKDHRLPNIKKITSGSTQKVADLVDLLYQEIISAGTYRAPSIKVAEAAKVIENTQRDLNIALINELAILFDKLELDTVEVLEAAGSKWNFLPFRPGLVGGHCIGVDPYYLTHKAEAVGYYPQVVLAGRRMNDGMGSYVASKLIKLFIKKKIQLKTAKVLIMGLSFKENCPDLRNSGVSRVLNELREYNFDIEIYDPWVEAEEAEAEFGLMPIKNLPTNHYDGVIIAVGHDKFKTLTENDLKRLCKPNHVIFDLKSIFPKTYSDFRL